MVCLWKKVKKFCWRLIEILKELLLFFLLLFGRFLENFVKFLVCLGVCCLDFSLYLMECNEYVIFNVFLLWRIVICLKIKLLFCVLNCNLFIVRIFFCVKFFVFLMIFFSVFGILIRFVILLIVLLYLFVGMFFLRLYFL